MATLKNTTINDTGFLRLPKGTTAQRPANAAGRIRHNTETGTVEYYSENALDTLEMINRTYLFVVFQFPIVDFSQLFLEGHKP